MKQTEPTRRHVGAVQTTFHFYGFRTASLWIMYSDLCILLFSLLFSVHSTINKTAQFFYERKVVPMLVIDI